jgi:hypothetical protein
MTHDETLRIYQAAGGSLIKFHCHGSGEAKLIHKVAVSAINARRSSKKTKNFGTSQRRPETSKNRAAI